MQTHILWEGLEYNSLENCDLEITDQGSNIDSVIIGSYNNKIFNVEYAIKTNAQWGTLFFELKIQHANNRTEMNYASDGNGNWTKEGKPVDEFKGCLDIDISLTPFTNTLPINRINLDVNKRQMINVLYLDVFNQNIMPVQQQYTRLSLNQYKFENVPNDFEAIITVDELGLVVNYPELFVRKNADKINQAE